MPKEGCEACDQSVRNCDIEYSDCQRLCAGKLTRLRLQPDIEFIVEEVLNVVC
jgi:hypothetical protein